MCIPVNKTTSAVLAVAGPRLLNGVAVIREWMKAVGFDLIAVDEIASKMLFLERGKDC